MNRFTINQRDAHRLQKLTQTKQPIALKELKTKIRQFLTTGVLRSKIITCAAFVENNKQTLKKIKHQEQKAKEQAQRLSKTLEVIKDELITQMQQAKLQTINSKQFSLTLKKTQTRVDVAEPSMIATNFYKVKQIRQLDKALLKASLLNGIKIPGASLEDVLSVVIEH